MNVLHSDGELLLQLQVIAYLKVVHNRSGVKTLSVTSHPLRLHKEIGLTSYFAKDKLSSMYRIQVCTKVTGRDHNLMIVYASR